MKALVLSLIVASAPVWASKTDKKLAQTDAERKGENARTAEKLSDLNYLRMKIIAIDNDVKDLSRTATDLAKGCGQEGEIELCYSRLNGAIETAEMRNHELGQVLLSPDFQSLQKRESNGAVGIEELVAKTREGLQKLLETMRHMRHDLGLKIARQKFKKSMDEVKVQSDKLKAEIRCGLEPIQLSRTLTDADVLVSRGVLNSNPLLIFKAEVILRRSIEMASALLELCADQVARLRALQQTANAKISGLPSMEERSKMASEACAQIKDPAPELKTACSEGDFSPGVLYSIDRALQFDRKQP